MFKHFPFIHNHGDFVHLDALRDWLRGVVSLETFLKSKNDKAIVKDMHFTDERTTVDYIDTKDDTEKTETLCEYLTSDVFDETNSTQFNKVDKISFAKNENGERRINVREKNNKKQRLSVILSNIPIAYDATTNTYNGTSKAHHIGVSENGVKIYNDETLQAIKEYKFPNGLIYPAGETYTTEDTTTFYKIGLNEDGITLYNDDNSEERKIRFGGSGTDFVVDKDLPNVDPFISVQDKTGETSLQLHKIGNFHATIVHNTVIGGQVEYALSGDLHIESGKYVVLQLNHGLIDSVDLAFSNVYPKYAEVANNTKGLITQITNAGSYGIQSGSPTFLTIYNQTEETVTVENLHFTF